MKNREIEALQHSILCHWRKVAHLNPQGLTDSWLMRAMEMCGVFASPRTLKSVRSYVISNLAFEQCK